MPVEHTSRDDRLQHIHDLRKVDIVSLAKQADNAVKLLASE
jgi:hypothetical protein